MTGKLVSGLLAVVLLLGLLSSVGQAAAFVVLDFNVSGTDQALDSMGRALRVMLVTRLHGQVRGDERYNVIEQTKVDQVLQQMGLPENCLIQGTQAVEIGQRLGADLVFVPTLTVMYDFVSLDLMVFETDTGQIVDTASIAGPRDDLAVLVTELVSGLAWPSGARDDYAVSGRVFGSSGTGIADVLISFSCGADSVFTQADGTWMQTGLRGETEIHAAKDGYQFFPALQTVEATASDLEFLGDPLPPVPEETRPMAAAPMIDISSRPAVSGSPELQVVYPLEALHPVEPIRKAEILENVMPTVGSQETHQVGNVTFRMRLAPAAIFPPGMDDRGTARVATNFWIAETEVTYELWYIVRQWAVNHGYRFTTGGYEGSTRPGGQPSSVVVVPTAARWEPVTMLRAYDCIVWCNALSEMLGLTPFYRESGGSQAVLRDGWARSGMATQKGADGFRLPTKDEWELAARYTGTERRPGTIFMDGLFWTPGSWASGASAVSSQKAATVEVAWYQANSEKTQAVGLKRANSLGCFDMSGNVSELCIDWSPEPRWVMRGGSWNTAAESLGIGEYFQVDVATGSNNWGFRIARNGF